MNIKREKITENMIVQHFQQDYQKFMLTGKLRTFTIRVATEPQSLIKCVKNKKNLKSPDVIFVRG